MEYSVIVWNKFEMGTMEDYHGLYLKCNILLSADVFEKLRNKSLKNYELCPTHFLRAPGISWDAVLKMINFELKLITDPEMLYSL